MSLSPTLEIHDLLMGLWNKVDHQRPDGELRHSFNRYVRKNPALLEALSNKHPARADSPSTYSPKTENDLFHMFRDPLAQVMTAMIGRVKELKDGKPVSSLDKTLAMISFYLENTQTHPYRALFNITEDDTSGFAEFLHEIDKVAPQIRKLIPAALEETSHGTAEFDHHYKELRSNSPLRVKGLLSYVSELNPGYQCASPS